MVLAVAPGIITATAASVSRSVEYNRDIRPILSGNCFYCHGPDAGHRKGKMRLDIREEALKREVFVPGKPQESELIRRILSANPEEVMPPLAAHKTLTPAQKESLRQWIAGGAKYEGHWAYQKPVRPVLPPRANPIDYLIQKRLEEAQLAPSAPADRRILARRLYFDLIGIPPRPEEVERFLSDKSPQAVSKLVEQLLASPHYGERMALGWLDVARYADTIGYHSDNPRNTWPYRDYVIRAFNQNKPFDVFTREQLAGDLLSPSGLEQKVGSAFNRLLLSTEEGGAQPKDYEARMLTDRVRAVGAVWLGQTLGCAQCHDHKFDPITSRDFYAMGAFFADIKEPIVGRREEGMFVPNESQAPVLARHAAEVKRCEDDYNGPHPELRAAYARWDQDESENARIASFWSALQPVGGQSEAGAKLEIKTDHSILVSGTHPRNTDTYTIALTNLPGVLAGIRIEALPDDSLPEHGPGRGEHGYFAVTKARARIQRAGGSEDLVAFSSARASAEPVATGDPSPARPGGAASVITPDPFQEGRGWRGLQGAGKPQQLILACGSPPSLGVGDTLTLQLEQNEGAEPRALGRFRISATTNQSAVAGPFTHPPPNETAEILVLPAEKREPAQKDKLWEAFKAVAPELEAARTSLAAARKAREEFEAGVARCLVSAVDEKPRTVRILPRGNFLLETGDIVQPAFPAYLKASWKDRDKPQLGRLDLANWLVSTENPLTARVVMNRIWKQFFGVGLAKPLDDFGAQGESPRNQALLDWLACEFMDSGWDIKHMVRLLVNSRAYQQTSALSKRARALDPENREFSAQGRWRLDAELVRDNALAISGLLADKIGGPSVKPYQPAGYWENLNFPTREWEQGTGEELYRRGLYTWWQRSYLHPSLLAFDAPSREECCAERTRSNIPQQALALLNDPTYVEAARAFAARICKEGGRQPEARFRWAWRQALDRAPRADEIATVSALLAKHLDDYRNDPQATDALLKVGAAKAPEAADPAELAAWTSVARVILNLHETVTRN